MIHLLAESLKFWNQICQFRIVIQVLPDVDHGVVDDRRHFWIRLKLFLKSNIFMYRNFFYCQGVLIKEISVTVETLKYQGTIVLAMNPMMCSYNPSRLS